jgi:sodium transport system permease protein
MNPFLSRMLVVFRKELKDGSRDRRAITTILFSALFAPALIAFMLNQVADRQREVEEVQIPVVGIENAPALAEWLRQQSGVEVVSGPEDAEQAVRNRSEDVVVVILPDFAEKFASSRPAKVRIVSDSSNASSQPKVERVRDLFRRYSAEIGRLRLIGRGVSPAIVNALEVEDVEVSSAQQRAARILGFIPMFILLAAFTAGMQIATDSTAGERERGSLEPLLVNPAPRAAIAGGKWLAASFGAMLSVMLTTTLCLAMMRFIPLSDLGIRFRLGPPEVMGVLAAVLPLCFFAAAVQIYLATFARSFKEAQSYMGLLIMIPMLPGIFSALYPIGEQLWMYPIPMLGQHVLMTEVLGGRPPAPMVFVLAGVVSVAVALIFMRLTTALFHREKIIFGR